MAGFSLDIKISSALLNAPKEKIQRALEAGGRAYMREMQDYPVAAPESTYGRTGATGNTAKFETLSFGESLNLMGKPQIAWLLGGTGVFGGGGQITASAGKLLSWLVTNPSHPLFGKRIFARSVRGMKWEGKAEQVKQSVIDAVKEDFKQP